MAWIKVKLKEQSIIEMPETVYNNMFKGNEAFVVIEEKYDEATEEKSEPIPTNKEEKKEKVEDVLQEPKLNEKSDNRKNTKKVSE